MAVYESPTSQWERVIKATPVDNTTKTLNTKITVELNISDYIGKYLYLENHRCKSNIYNVWYGN